MMRGWMILGIAVAWMAGCSPGAVDTVEPNAVKRVPEKPDTRPAKDPVCTEDAMCVLVNAGCCGCNSGGARMAVHVDALDAHAAKLEAECGDGVACLTVISDDPSCQSSGAVCLEGQCLVGPPDMEQP